ncbi:Glutamate-1-semialdehyde 2,1-aminomutase [Methanosarcinaceae archaeon Ag5]|uniref:Glutamate-1-semialdehyde 2,1-aminomutase n=1 Tax=Methanolapillus africanus TaxID=3028297 RepID=A0AAE4MI32_9EURY|nr:Glutamate-1-semialdehyde 2,1-aminomutase [Methanosarcinaceae archaeon Ag5]
MVKEEKGFQTNHAQSEKLYEAAKKIIPGGVSSPVRAIKPFPFYTASADGSKIYDADGNEFIDYCMAYGPAILGHNHPVIKQAITAQLDKGWLYGTPTDLEVELAKRVNNFFPSVEMMRFVSSGSEATMSAIRLARGFTKKNKIIKIEGGFHGAHDAVLVKAGSGATTHGEPNSPGIPADVTKNTLQVAYNDIEAMADVIEKNKNDMAAVIIEPVLGNIGPVLPNDGYLQELRKLTAENDCLLIFDEVITGFRLAAGGAQEYYNIKPDLTTLGKIAGGGMPVGVFGGRKEILELISPNGPVYQAGTFSGSPCSMAAGIATLDYMKQNNIWAALNKKGDAFRKSLSDIVADKKLDYYVGGLASLFVIFFGQKPANYQDVLKCDSASYMKFFEGMLNDGVFLPPSQFETNFISMAHTDEDYEKTFAAVEKNLPKAK